MSLNEKGHVLLISVWDKCEIFYENRTLYLTTESKTKSHLTNKSSTYSLHFWSAQSNITSGTVLYHLQSNRFFLFSAQNHFTITGSCQDFPVSFWWRIVIDHFNHWSQITWSLIFYSQTASSSVWRHARECSSSELVYVVGGNVNFSPNRGPTGGRAVILTHLYVFLRI